MATEDLNKKNNPEEKAGKTTGEKTEPAKEEIESTSAADTGLTIEPGNNVIKEATPEEIEEAGIDEEETESSSTTGRRCQKIDGEYYCFRLQQGRWIQWSVISYPTKKMCEAVCCKA